MMVVEERLLQCFVCLRMRKYHCGMWRGWKNVRLVGRRNWQNPGRSGGGGGKEDFE